MRTCPKCGDAMTVAQSITVGGLENKDIAWRCDRDGVTAELRHPVQYVHVNVGDVDEVDGRRRRLVHKEIRGAELVVYHEWMDGGPAPAPPPAGARGGKRAPEAGPRARAKRTRPAKRRRPAKRTKPAKRAAPPKRGKLTKGAGAGKRAGKTHSKRARSGALRRSRPRRRR